MPRRVDGFGGFFARLGEKLADAAQAPQKPKREKRLKMTKDSRRGMSGRAVLAGYADQEPMTLEELLARLDLDQRAALLALSEPQQLQVLALYEAFDRRLEAPGSHKAAVLAKLAGMLVSGRLVGSLRADGGLLAELAGRLDAGPALRGRMDGLLFMSYVVATLAEPKAGPAVSKGTLPALCNSLALAWPARWGQMALALAFDGRWQGMAAVLRPGGAPPDGLVQGSVLAFADTIKKEPDIDHALLQIDVVSRLLETDRGAELDVEGRDPAWALAWLLAELGAGFPARAGIVIEGKGQSVRVTEISGRKVVFDGRAMALPAFLASLRRVVVDGDYLSQVGLG